MATDKTQTPRGDETVAAGHGKSLLLEDEETRKLLAKVKVKGSHVHPHTLRYLEEKLHDKGLHRMERHPADGLSLARKAPKSGHGGKFTWEGPVDVAEAELDPVPPAIDPRDPNYIDDDQEASAKAAEELVVGEVEAAKVAEARKGVSRIEVQPPVLHPY